jgi:hypothetical protein
VRASPGDRLALAVDVQRLHFFATGTGEALGAGAGAG